MANLAAIVEEGERQIGDYKTMILPIGDARRLLAVARAAVEMREVIRGSSQHPNATDRGRIALAAFDAAVLGEEEKKG